MSTTLFLVVSVINVIVYSLDQEILIWELKIIDETLQNTELSNWDYDANIISVSDATNCPQSLSNEFCLKLSEEDWMVRITNCSEFSNLRLEYNVKVANIQNSMDECVSYFGIDSDYGTNCDNCTLLTANNYVSQLSFFANTISLPSITDYNHQLIIYFEAEGDVNCYINDIKLYGSINSLSTTTKDNTDNVESKEEENNDNDSKGLSVFALVVIIFFSVAGGIICIILMLRCIRDGGKGGIGGRAGCPC